MSIRIEGSTAYVSTVDEAFAVIDNPDVEDYVIEDNMERIKMLRLLKAMGIK